MGVIYSQKKIIPCRVRKVKFLSYDKPLFIYLTCCIYLIFVKHEPW